VVFRKLCGMSVALAFAVSSWGAVAQEAPMLKALVDAGNLPPLAERLPANPFVVDPLNEVGAYGGTLRRGSESHPVRSVILFATTTHIDECPMSLPISRTSSDTLYIVGNLG